MREPIYSKQGEELKSTISNLISSHNTLCSIEEAFQENKYAKQYFEDARQKVLESGNQSLAAMYAIAIENMSKFIEDSQEVDYEVSELWQ